MKIQYKVKGTTYEMDMQTTDRDTPRSVYFAAIKDYGKQTKTTVRLPGYDDDNDAYSAPSVDPKIVWNDEFLTLPTMKGRSKKEVKAMFA